MFNSMTQLVLDVDPGVDDALAILFALKAVELTVLGISVVSGNVSVDRGVMNSLGLLGMLGRRDIPVYRGAERPLAKDPIRADHVHGRSGMGEAQLPPARAHASGDSIDFIVQTLTAHEGDITLVALGPLTNLVLAESRSPGVLPSARQVVVMGGSKRVPGNVTAVSEFNFHADPQAARSVLNSGARILVVPLDVTRRVTMTGAEIRRLAAEHSSEVTRFFEAASRTALAFAESVTGEERISLHDPTAVAAAFCPEMFEIDAHWLDVEIRGEITEGQLVADRRPSADPTARQGRMTDCCVGVKADEVLERILQTAFGQLGAR